MGDGLIFINLYINDSVGYVNSEDIVIIRDTLFPWLSVNSPASRTKFVTTLPVFSLTVLDLNLEKFWYTIDGGAETNVSISSGITVISLSQAVFDSLAEGSHTITFFVSDAAGNERSIAIIIIKEFPSSADPTIPLGDYYLIFIGVAITTLIMIERKKKNQNLS